MKLCRKENVEQHIWKILYYNLIEYFKVLIADSKSEPRSQYFQGKLIEIIEDGLTFYNHLLDVLQTTYNFQLNDLLEADVEARGKAFDIERSDLFVINEWFTFQSNSRTTNSFNLHWCQRKSISCFWVICPDTRKRIRPTIIWLWLRIIT